MLDFLRLLIDWRDLLQVAGADAVVYAAFALLGTAIFVVRLGLSLVLGIDGDVDFDVEAEGAGGGFGVLSVLSVTAFFMGTGWMGLIARLEWGLSPTPAAAAAVGSGLVLMLLAAGMMLAMQRAAHHVAYDPSTAVGRTGTVYMAIPAAGGGPGQVRVSVQGRSMIVNAVSTGPAIASFVDVKVVAARDARTLVVEAV